MRMKIFLSAVFTTILISSGSAQIHITAPDTSADQDSTFVVPVTVSDVTGLEIISFQFDMTYDENVLLPLDVNLENTISSIWNDLYFNLNNPGIMTIAAFGIDPLAGSGSLVNIEFKMTGQPEDSTKLDFGFVEFSGDTTGIIKESGIIRINSNTIQVEISTTLFDSAQILVDDTVRISPYVAEWMKGSVHHIEAPSPQLHGDIRYLFENWSDDGLQRHSVSSFVDTIFTANYSAQYYLTLASDFGTLGGAAWYDSGAVANFSVDPEMIVNGDTRNQFQSWRGTGDNSYTGSVKDTSVVMTNPIIEEAIWDTQFFLKVNSAHGNPYGDGWYTDGDTATFGIDTVHIELDNTLYSFESWLGEGASGYTGTDACVDVIMDSPAIETAIWDTAYYVEVRSDPIDLLDISDIGWYAKGHLLMTTAAPDTVEKEEKKYFFLGWRINGSREPGNPVTVSVDSPLVIVAEYGKAVNVVITTTAGAGTNVVVDSVEYEAPYAAAWLSGAEHTIGVPEYQGEGDSLLYKFVSWNIGGERLQSVSADTDRTFIATLGIQYILELHFNPWLPLTGFGSDWYDAGETVTAPGVPEIAALDSQTYRFTTFTVNGDTVLGNPIEVIMSGPMYLIAHYHEAFRISGTVLADSSPLPDVQMLLTGTESDTADTEQNGDYLYSALFAGSYVLTPEKEGYRFEPEERVYPALMTDMLVQDFIAIDTTTALESNETLSLPQEYMLHQNYPNPFNNTTILPYQLPEESSISITIYNLLGQPVRRFVSKTQQAGYYKISWDGKDDANRQLPSGVYIYQMDANRIIDTKKMILLE